MFVYSNEQRLIPELKSIFGSQHSQGIVMVISLLPVRLQGGPVWPDAGASPLAAAPAHHSAAGSPAAVRTWPQWVARETAPPEVVANAAPKDKNKLCHFIHFIHSFILSKEGSFIRIYSTSDHAIVFRLESNKTT